MVEIYLASNINSEIRGRIIAKKNIFTVLFITFCFLFTSISVKSQTASQYQFTASSGAYNPITGTSIPVSFTDDGISGSVPLPFSFTFAGTVYTSFSLSTNGLITLGGAATNSWTNTFASTAVTYPVLAPLWDDLQALSTNGDIVYTTAGSSPNQIFTIQYTGFRWNFVATGSTISFQVKLYEAALPSPDFGRIDFIYNQEAGTLNLPSASIGIASSSNNYLSLNNSTSAPIASSTVNTTSIATKPNNGQVYTFTPPAPCSGAPTPGATNASVTSICAGSGGTSNLSFTTSATGTTYQWQSAPSSGGPWTNLSGASTNATYSATGIAATAWYHCVVTCTSGGAFAASTPVQIIYDPTCVFMPLNSSSSVTTCAGTFYDHAGSAANYGNNEHDTITIFPSTPGASIRVTFNSFSTESGWDGLLIYNGPNTGAGFFSSGLPAGPAAPAGSYYGTNSPGTITSTAADGSLTFVFNSDPSVTFPGWVATLSCIAPCSGTPAPGLTLASNTNVCTGETTALSLSNTNMGSGISYQWEFSTDNSTWNIVPGATLPTLTQTINANTWYHCVVTCTNGGLSSTSGSISIASSSCDFINMPLNSYAEIATCAGHFYDAAGPSGAYSNFELDTLVIFPSTTDAFVRLNFNSFQTESGFDGMLIFNGSSVAAPLIRSGRPAGVNPTTCPADSYYGTVSPGIITSTASDGALTIVFMSDNIVTAAGWDATISCYTAPVCSGTPMPGNTTASSTSLCVGASTLLGIQNAMPGSGIDYQWQKSINGGVSYTDIPGETNAYLSTTISATTWFQCVVTCSISSVTQNISNPIQIIYNASCINMPAAGSISTCSSSFYDSGGSGAGYGFNEDRTFTITPSLPARLIRVTFNSFSLEAGFDSLFIYDGNSTASPLIGAYSTTSPGIITSSAANGSLTFVFHSDFSNNSAGWDATVACIAPPTCGLSNTRAGEAVANPTQVCAGESTILSLIRDSITLGVTYQWQYATTNTGPWSPLVGANSLSCAPTVNSTLWYRCKFTCNAADPAIDTTSIPVQVISNATPTITGNTAGTRCGLGTVNLIGSASAGATLNWYSDATSGNLLGTGTTFTTPVINTTTTYYLGALSAGITESGGKPSATTTAANLLSLNYGIEFDASRNFILNSVKIYPVGTGTVTLALQNSAGIELAVTAPVAVTGTGATAVTVPLAFSVPIGSGYRLVLKAYTGITNLVRETSGVIFPYISSSLSLKVTDSWVGTTSTVAAYYWFYSLNITTGCESDRVAVTATVTPAPAISSSNPSAVCPGTAVTLSASSTNSGYTYVWTPGNLVGATATVTPTTNTIYTVTATDNSGGANNGCVNIFSDTAVVNIRPTALVISPASANICIAPTVTALSVISGGLMPDGSSANITWSPATNLFRDLACTIPYILGAVTPTVYLRPTAAGVFPYIATATSESNCISTGTATLTVVDSTSSITINANPSGTICTGVSITFTPTVIRGGLVSSQQFIWYLINAATATAASVGTTITVASTGQLIPGNNIVVSSGVGAFTSTTTILSVLSPTQFIVSAAPLTAIQSGAVIAQQMLPILTATSPTFTTSSLINGNQIRCVFKNSTYTCNPNNPASSNIITLSLNPSSPSSVSLSTASTTICATVPTTFTATTATGGTNPTYQFYVNGVSMQGPGISNTYTTSSLTNGAVVKVKMVSNANNCPNPNPALDSVTMTVNPSFPVSDTLTAFPGVNVCVGTAITFTSTPTNPGTNPLYTFRKNGSVVQASSSPIYNAIAANGDSYDCILLSSNSSCALGNPDTSNVLTISAQPQEVTVSITTSPAAPCNGNQVTYTANGFVNGFSFATGSYQFYVNNGIPLTSTGNICLYTPQPGDSISVNMSTNLSCGAPNPATSFIKQTLFDNPNAAVTNSGLTCNANALTLDAGASPGSGTITNYQWNLIGTGNVGVNSSSHYATASGNYSVVVTNSNGCSFTSPTVSITVPTTASPLSGNYTIGAITATGASSVLLRDTITVASTNNLVVGAMLSITSGTGTGTLAAGTYITQIIDATRIRVSAAPTVALSGASIAGATCSNYVSFTAAISDLNSRFITGTGCTFNVSAGFVENLTARLDLGNANLNAALAAPRTIVFQKSGAGANPIINAYVGTNTPATTVADGIWALSGADNITIDRIDLNDGNTTNPATMEYGYGLFRLSANDGAQNNTIKGCTITLNKVNNVTSGVVGSSGILLLNVTTAGYNSFPTSSAANGSGAGTTIAVTNSTGLSVGQYVVVASGTGVFAAGTYITSIPNTTSIVVSAIPTTALNIAGITGYAGSMGTNSNNKFYSNNITNCNNGIVLSGYATLAGGTTPISGDFGNDVGGATSATGNTITNFGGGGSNASAGIVINNQWGCNISYNTINNNNGSGAYASGGTIRGIYGQAGVSANVTINNNTITINGNAAGIACYGIDNSIGSTAASNTVNINNNSVTGGNALSSASSGTFYAIYNLAVCTNLNMNGNSVSGCTFPSTATADWKAINNAATGCSNVNMNSNNIINNKIQNTNISAFNALYSGAVTVGSPPTASFNNNIIRGNTKSASATTALNFSWINLAISAGCVVSFSNNIITEDTVNYITGILALTVNGIGISAQCIPTSDNNFIRNVGVDIKVANAGAVTVNGYIDASTSSTTLPVTISRNTIRRLFITSTSGYSSTAANIIYGITTIAIANSAYKNIYLNNIDSLFTYSSIQSGIIGIRNANGGLYGGVNIYKNKIHSIIPGGGASYAKGISLTSGVAGTIIRISNNMVSIDLTNNLQSGSPGGITGTLANNVNNIDGIRGIALEYTIANDTINVYHNTIRLAGTGTGSNNFGSSGIFHTINTTATSAALDMRNNIIDNECIPFGTGLVVAFRRSAGTAGSLANYASTSNNNIFYVAGLNVPAANKLIYSDGTAAAQTISAYKAGVFTAGTISPRDQASDTAKPNFVSTTDLHLQGCVSNNALIDNHASLSSGISDDIDGEIRGTGPDPNNPDIGADEVSGTSFGGRVDASATVCSGLNSGTLTLTGYTGTITRWETSIDNGGTWQAVTNTTTTQAYTNLTATTRYRAVVNAIGCGPANSIYATITVNSTPTITSTLTGSLSICAGGTLQLTGSATAAVASPWVSNTPAVATITNTGGIVAQAAGTSIIRYTNANGCYKDTIVNVIGLPAISGTLNVCVGSTTTLTGTATAASLNAWLSASQLVATVDPVTGIVNGLAYGTSVITYKNDGNCTITATVTVDSLPRITGAAPICMGGQVQLTGAPSTTPNSWVSLAPSVATVNSTGLVAAVTSGTATIRYTSFKGCIKETVITVNAKPTISLTSGGASITSDTLCAGETISLYGTASSQLPNAWVTSSSAIGSLSTTSTTNTVLTAVAGGSCNVTYTNTNGCSQTIAVTVYALPARYNLTGGGTYCANVAGVPIGLLNSQLGVNYQLYRTPSTTVGVPVAGNGLAITFGIQSTAGTYYVQAANASNPCSKYMLDSVKIKANALPVISGTIALCSGSTSQLTADSAVNTINPWVPADNTVISISNTGFITGLSIGSSLVTYTDVNNCQNQVTVSISTPSTGGTVSSNANVCTGASGSVTLSGNTGGVLRWLSFTTPAGPWTPMAANTTTSQAYAGLSITTKYRALVQNGGCPADSSGIATITVNPIPTVFNVTGGGAYCAGGAGNTINLSGSQTGISYSLIRNGSTLVTIVSGTGSALVFPAQTLAGTYTVTANNSSTACSSPMTGSAVVTVTAIPTVTINETGPFVICAPLTQALTSSTTNSTYQWYLDGVAIASGGTSQGITVSNVGTGVYTLLVTNNGCTSLKTKGVVVTITPIPTSVSITPTTATICLGGSTYLTAGSDSVIGPDVALYENFNDTAHISFTRINGSFSPNVSNWKYHSVPFTKTTGAPTFRNYTTNDGGWFARADADAGGSGSTTQTELNSPVFSLANYSSASLSFEHTLQTDGGESYVEVDISTDGGATWNLLRDFRDSTRGVINIDAQTTANENIDLSAYLGQSNLKISYYYVSDYGWYWNVDNIKVAGNKTYPTTYTWSPSTGLNTPTGYNVNASPALTQTYTVTAASSVGCSATATAVVNVNKLPTITTEPVGATLCLGGSAPSLTVTAIGNIQTYQWYIHTTTQDSLLQGANASTYTANISTADTTRYFVIVDGPCGSDTSNIVSVIVRPNTSITTQPATPVSSVCENSSPSLTVVAAGANLTYQWFSNATSSTAGSVSIPAANSASYTPATTAVGTVYYYVVITGSCPATAVTSSIVPVSVTAGGTWLGLNTNWNDATNWCGGVPTNSTNVTIPIRGQYPLINISNPVCNNISIASGASLSIASGGKLSISGTINNSGTFNAKNGTIEMSGASAQIIPAAVFQNNYLMNLIINNSSVTLAGQLNLLGKLSFSGSNRVFNIGDSLLALKSSDTSTAYLGDITKDANTSGAISSNVINGNAIIERYISSRRAWRLLSMPTTHNAQTIRMAWQEGSADATENPNIGNGFQVTSNRSSWLADGFDGYSSAGPSVKVYNPATNVYDGIISTIPTATPTVSDGKFEIGKAYMTFIRGDRSVSLISQSPTPTILREKGAFLTGSYTLNNLGTSTGQFVSVGNLYASAIDFSKLTRTNISQSYYLWDPKPGSYGIYATFITDGNAVTGCVNCGVSTSFASGNYNIQSGQGFFITTNGGVGSLTFTENSKVDGSNLASRQEFANTSIRTTLYKVQADNSKTLIDEVLNIFDDNYSNSVDNNDAIKLGNLNENLGMARDGKLLAIETKFDLQESDTIFYKLGQIKLANYRFVFTPQSIEQNGMQAFLEDNYLNTRTPISLTDTTRFDFSILNNAASYSPDRFRMVFKLLSPVPVTFVDVKAEKQNKDVLVSWKVENEISIGQYIIEKSNDGRSFAQIGTKSSTGISMYNWLDVQPFSGNNFYRIRSVGIGGENKYSRVVKVLIATNPSITVYPNPVKEDRVINVKLSEMPQGIYYLRIINDLGQSLMSKSINHTGGTNEYPIILSKRLAHGHYNLELMDHDNVKTIIKILF